MVDDKYSCLKEVTRDVPITLSCEFQCNEIAGISDVLESWKRQYIKQLQGIVVSYKNVSLLSKYAYIKSDYPVIMCNVRATFELFIPKVGSIAKGKINRISYDYIGCLVHNTINVAINRSNEPEEVAKFIALDREILFEITHLGFKRKTIRVKGNITEKCANLMISLNFPSGETNVYSNNRVTYSSDSNEDGTGEEYIRSDDVHYEEGSQSQSLLCNANLYIDSSSNIGPDSLEKKKSNLAEKHSVAVENSGESQSILDNNSKLFSESLSDTSHASLQKKRKKSKSKHDTFKDFEFSSNDISNNDNVFSREGSTTDSGGHSPKKKKLNLSNKISSDNHLAFNSIVTPNVQIKEGNSTDTSSHHSTSSKKKKHKKSKKDLLNSPSIFSDSLSSSKDDIKPFKIPVTPAKKRHKKSQDKLSFAKKSDKKNFSSVSSQELYNNCPEDFEKLMETFSSFDPSVNKTELFDNIEHNIKVNDKSLDLIKKAKKRKRESSDIDDLPKKKKKIEGNESIAKKSSSKHKNKTSKKNKDKSVKDSKKDEKKKLKKKVISSKKKLPKLKKKRDKSEKLKSKKSKKSSKHKEKDAS